MRVRTVDFQSPSAGEEFSLSLRETGFAVLENHPIERSFLEQLYAGWEKFFASEEKQLYFFERIPDNRARAGFFPQEVSETAVSHTAKDLKEFYQVVVDGPLPPSCEARTLGYREQCFALGKSLLRWLEAGTPKPVLELLSRPLTEMISLEASMLRILHYPPLVGSEAVDAVRAAAHEDINLITILPVAKQPGLQVKDNQGSWIDVSGNSGDIVVNSGDMLREATADYYPSTTHRVLNPGGAIRNESRISSPMFLGPDFDVRLSDRYTSGSYLDERLKQIHR